MNKDWGLLGVMGGGGGGGVVYLVGGVEFCFFPQNTFIFILCDSATLQTCSNSTTIIRSALTYFSKGMEVLKNSWHCKTLCKNKSAEGKW